MTLIVSEKPSPSGLLLVVTDKNLLGKIFSEGNRQLDLSKNFYEGQEIDLKELKHMMVSARHLHLTGKEAVALGIELDLVDHNHILYINKIPHAEVVNER
jgi:hypothetical protein